MFWGGLEVGWWFGGGMVDVRTMQEICRKVHNLKK